MVDSKLLFWPILLVAFLLSCSNESDYNQTTSSGKKIGEWFYIEEGDTTKKEFYDEKSYLIREVKYKKGKKLVEILYSDKMQPEKKVWFYETGAIEMITFYENGKRINQETYFSNGNTEIVSNYNKKGELVGEFLQYYTNGELNYKSDNIGNGRLEVYDSTGQLVKIYIQENYNVVDSLMIDTPGSSM